MSQLDFKWDINYTIPVYDRTPHKKLDAAGNDPNSKNYKPVEGKVERKLQEIKPKAIVNKNYDKNPLYKNFERSQLQL